MTSRFRDALRHAFAVEPAGPAEPSAEERAALDPLIAEVRRRGMVGPAVLFLESVSPLNNVGAQSLHFMQPFGSESEVRRITVPSSAISRRPESSCSSVTEFVTPSVTSANGASTVVGASPRCVWR